MTALTTAEIGIANLGLLRIGVSKLIVTAADATNEQAVATTIYPYARDYVLQDYPWEFASKHATLVTSAGTLPANWASIWTYPSDCIKVQKLIAPGTRKDEPIPFEIVNLGTSVVIACNEATAPTVVYTMTVTDPLLMDPGFITALSYYLGAEMALALRADPAMAKGAMDAYTGMKAAATQAREGLAATKLTLNSGTATATSVITGNMALSRLGHQKMITTITEHTDEARLINQFYSRAVATILKAFPWSWATKRATLVTTAMTTVTGWEYAYVVPTDCAYIRQMVNPLGRSVRPEQKIPFEVGYDATGVSVIYSDLLDAELLYTTNSVTEANFDPTFREALSWLLAGDIAPGLGYDLKISAYMRQAYFGVISQAKADDLNLGYDTPPSCEYLAGRS